MHQKHPPAKIAVAVGVPLSGIEDFVELLGSVFCAFTHEETVNNRTPAQRYGWATKKENGIFMLGLPQVLNVGNASPFGTKASATPLLQYRFPVGIGPSLNTWP
jgi:hypothetical protein